jgi:hypothetical protein
MSNFLSSAEAFYFKKKGPFFRLAIGGQIVCKVVDIKEKLGPTFIRPRQSLNHMLAILYLSASSRTHTNNNKQAVYRLYKCVN